MAYRWYEKQSNGQLIELELLGEKVDDTSPLILLQVHEADVTTPQTPRAPDLSATQPAQTTIILTWTAVAFPGPPITGWEVERQSSTDDGASFGLWAPISGSPFTSTLLTKTDTVSFGSPEIIFNYRIRAVNADGVGEWSIIFGIQWNGTVLNAPNRPTNLLISNIQATSVQLSWTEAVGASTDQADQQAIYSGNTLLVGNLSSGIVSYTWSNLTQNTTYSDINIRRHNSAGWSTGSNWVDFATTQSGTFTFAPLIGCSNSVNTHGGTDDWDAWRVYAFSSGTDGGAISIASRTGATHPKSIALTDDGSGSGGIWTNYASANTFWINALDEFYYGGNGSQTIMTPHAVRGDVELHIANGNEYGDKVNSGNMTGFVNGCRGIYDATRVLNPNGSRRYPLASSWLDPTHNQEQTCIIDSEKATPNLAWSYLSESIGRAVPYLDGVAWSMYPPGRDATAADPTLDWPSFDLDMPYDDTLSAGNVRLQRCYLTRCFARTYMCQYPSTNPYISSFKPLKIACWEIGTGDFPLSQSIRPYYAAHVIASMGALSKQTGLTMSTIYWWDNEKAEAGSPQNILTDEPNPGTGQITTRQAWQNWNTYNHFEGDSHPADWPANPPNTWPNRSTAWKDEWVADMNAAWPL